MNTIRIALAVALFAVTSSVAFAAPKKHINAHGHSVLQQREVALPSEPTDGNSVGPFWYNWSGPTKGGM